MNRSWSGPLVAGMIVVGVAAILFFNFQPDRPSKVMTPPVSKTSEAADPVASQGGPREYPIGEPTSRNHLQVAAVWLPGVTMDGMSSGATDLIHLEADIRSLGDNPNGFAKDEFIPYLKVTYSIAPLSGGPVVDRGELFPMIASDGLHYGANISLPKPGAYRLIYAINPRPRAAWAVMLAWEALPPGGSRSRLNLNGTSRLRPRHRPWQGLVDWSSKG